MMNDLDDGQLSGPSAEDLRLENEIQKLKMQAESGAVFEMIEDVPPEIEHEFLRHIQEFEKAFQHCEFVKVYDFLGRPEFKKADELKSDELLAELDRLMLLMTKHNILLHTPDEYSPAAVYHFITEELFDCEMENISLPGLTLNFIYEEFHPGND